MKEAENEWIDYFRGRALGLGLLLKRAAPSEYVVGFLPGEPLLLYYTIYM